MRNAIEYLKKWQKGKKSVSIYCAGQHGLLFSEILKLCGIKIDVYFDGDCNKWGKVICDNIYCMNPNEITDKARYILLICIDLPYYENVKRVVQATGYENIMDFNDILDDIILNYRQIYTDLIKLCQNMPMIGLFYTPSSSLNQSTFREEGTYYHKADRIAIYTGIFGDYDEVCEPTATPEQVDYFFISDEKPTTEHVFKWIDAKKVIPSDIISPVKRNRYIKMHPHILFPDYKYSVYIDGNITVKEDITSFVKKNPSGIAAFLHPKRDCIFYEAMTIANSLRVVADDVCRQMKKYLNEGMPLHYGMPEMSVIAREHINPICIRIMNDWWVEFDSGAQRDQLSFMYAMWKNGVGLSDISSLGEDAHKDKRLKFRDHYCESRMLSNGKI